MTDAQQNDTAFEPNYHEMHYAAVLAANIAKRPYTLTHTGVGMNWFLAPDAVRRLYYSDQEIYELTR